MNFVTALLTESSVAHAILIFGLVIASGLALGSVRFLGIRLGVAGVLFSGILFAHLRYSVDERILEFVREFGLILFVYTIGLQVGPGFIASFKRQGFLLNLAAACVVLGGVILTLIFHYVGGVPLAAAVGILSGATTNTPSLGAAQQALQEVNAVSREVSTLPGLGYAIAYPFGIVGIIISMVATRALFRLDPSREAAAYALEHSRAVDHPRSLDIRVENPNLDGLTVEAIPGLRESEAVVSRVMHAGRTTVASSRTIIALGDILRVVGPSSRLENVRRVIGTPSKMETRALESEIDVHRIVVTRPEVDGVTVADLNAPERFEATITRVIRSELELVATPDLEIRLADVLVVVGVRERVDRLAAEVGNTPGQLDHPQLIPVFIGIALGVLLGSWPIHLPGMPSSIKLGLAGGPLLVAMVFSRIGRIGRLVWYMPPGANFMLRELGITLFLACVGLRAGGRFVQTLVGGNGLYWMLCGAAITLIPLVIVAFIARRVWKLNYMIICGLLAGSMTDPPALAFANSLATSNAPSISYATVYPLVMILRVLSAQVLILFLM